MINIRPNIFETNSSSVHCMTLLTEDEYNKWNTGDYYLDIYNNIILNKDEMEIAVSEYINKWGEDMPATECEYEEVLSDMHIYSPELYDSYTEDYETFVNKYNKDGQIFYAVGYTGYDG